MMHKTIGMKSIRVVAYILVLVMVAPCIAFSNEAETTPVPVKQSILVFPSDDTMGAGSSIVEHIQSFVTQGLSESGGFSAFEYSSRLPSVARLKATEPEKKIQPNGPFSIDNAAMQNAVAISKSMNVDLALVGEISKYMIDQDGVVKITVTAQLLDVGTGKVLQTIAAYGNSKPSSEIYTEEGRINDASVDVGKKIIEAITGEEYKTPVMLMNEGATEPITKAPIITKKKNKIPIWMWVAAAAGIGLLLSSSNDGDDEDPEGPPDPPL